MILVGVKDDGGSDEGGPGPELGEDAEYGRRVAKDIGALMYLECDLVSYNGLKNVFDEVRSSVYYVKVECSLAITC